ncbi:MAG: MFS transporter [Gammaproteobacteria bacterium]|nr:MFS transporter [Gammaproteobacteria bacterium]
MIDGSFRAGFSLMRDPNINRLFIAYLVSYSGTAMAPIAMAFGVLELTGSTSDAAIVIAAPTLAAIVVLLFGGVLADRTSRQKIIYWSELLAMAAQACLAALFIFDLASIPLLTLFMLINGIALALHAPAATGLIILLVDKKDLQATNALLGSARNGAIAGGAALGGILVAAVGAGWTLAIDAVSFGLSAILVISLRPNPQIQPKAASVLADLRLGWNEFTSHTWLWVIVAQFSLIVAVGQSVFGLIGPAVTRDYMGGATHWGFIASAFGLGTLAGGILAMRIKPKYPMRFATFCVFFFSGVSLTLALLLPVHVIAAAAFISGFTGQIFAVLWYTTLQMKIPGHMLSRVSAYDHLGSIVLAPLGIVAAGLLYESLGFQTTLLIAAAIIIVPTIIVLCVRDVWTMTNK